MDAPQTELPSPESRSLVPQTYETGIYTGMPEEEYRPAAGLNKSQLDDIAISPALAIWRRFHPAPQTQAMALGSALHCLVLEPERFAERFVASAYPAFQSKDAKEWYAAQTAAGLTVLRTKSADPVRDPSEWDRVHGMAAAVAAHPIAGILFADDGPAEMSLFWLDQFAPTSTRRLCKGRLDKWAAGHDLIVDLKKVPVEGAAMSSFARKVHEYRYHVQAAFYSDGMSECGHPPRAFVFVVVEEEPPYQVALYTLPREWIQQGRAQYVRDLEIASSCIDSGEWPSYPIEVRELQQPGFAKFSPIS